MLPGSFVQNAAGATEDEDDFDVTVGQHLDIGYRFLRAAAVAPEAFYCVAERRGGFEFSVLRSGEWHGLLTGRHRQHAGREPYRIVQTRHVAKSFRRYLVFPQRL